MTGHQRSVFRRGLARLTEPTPVIDVHFDVGSDSGGRDADKFSKTLQRYHQLLWSKQLPDGGYLDLQPRPSGLLVHTSTDRCWSFSSDRAVPSLAKPKAMRTLVPLVPVKLLSEVQILTRTIGGRIIWPSKQVNRQMTINGARGTNARIMDRFDLTLECVRRHYAGGASPLSAVLDRYAHFFELFKDFTGYVDFFLLQDLLTNAGEVAFFAAFDNFVSSPVPAHAAAYEQYLASAGDFLEARNNRIHAYARTLPGQS